MRDTEAKSIVRSRGTPSDPEHTQTAMTWLEPFSGESPYAVLPEVRVQLLLLLRFLALRSSVNSIFNLIYTLNLI
jgi:hypothetical protein